MDLPAPTMTLSQMQDIGGCRAIVATATEVSRLCEDYAESESPRTRSTISLSASVEPCG
jgi:hypothetical protein